MVQNRSSLQVTATASVTERVLASVADSERADILSLPPLYDAVDPDALEQLVEHGGVTEISFVYLGYDVRVRGDGRVRVSEIRGRSDRTAVRT